MLDPIDTSKYTRDQVRELAQHCHDLMDAKIKQLNKEVELLDSKK